MLAGRKGVSSSKGYKRGQGSLGPSSSQGLRPGTAQKRPASPNTQGLLSKGVNYHHNGGPSPYSLGLTQHNNLIGGVSSGVSGHVMNKQRVNSHKPSSAPSKNRIRSQSPMNIEGQGQQQTYQQHAASAKQKNLIGGTNFGVLTASQQ